MLVVFGGVQASAKPKVFHEAGLTKCSKTTQANSDKAHNAFLIEFPSTPAVPHPYHVTPKNNATKTFPPGIEYLPRPSRALKV